jgi:DNA (cytosine-5)-methyltransferase 1
VVENVTEFKDRWRFYRHWIGMIEALGYQVSENVLCALDFGVPQRRTRLFLVFTPTKKPFDLKPPRSRHCPRSVSGLKGKDKLPFKPLIHRGAGDPPENWVSVDEWDPISVGNKALQREAKLKKRIGKVPPVWFWANTDTAPLDAAEPCGTITAESGNQLYLMKGRRMRRFSVYELRGAMGFPKGYLLPSSLTESGRLLGNAVVPQISEFIVRQLIARA